MTDRDNFLLFATVGFVLMVAGGVYRPLSTRRPELRLLGIGIGLMFLGLAGLGAVAYVAFRVQQSPEVAEGLKTYFYFSMSVAVTGFAFVNPSVSALVSKRADPHRQGEVLGVNQACASLGRILGPFVGSVAFQLHPSHTLPFVCACVLLLLVVMLLPVAARSE
jgi:MFS family permease